jgi:hypothetical protein
VVIGGEQLVPLDENVRAALNFTPISESARQKPQEKAPPHARHGRISFTPTRIQLQFDCHQRLKLNFTCVEE